MKGPAKPPVTLSVYYQFRDWERLVAVNVKSGRYRVYRLPPLMTDVDPSRTTPAFTLYDGAVYVGLSNYIGILPAWSWGDWDDVHFEMDQSGEGVFSLGSDAPSQVKFTWMNGRYVLYANGWRAPQMAASMVDLSAY